MPNIQIAVSGKTAQVVGSPTIVCGNSDYTVDFTFDAEWSAYAVKTARIRFYINGVLRRHNIPFTGNFIQLPPLYDTPEVEIGVYIGNIRATTPARIPCDMSIMDGDPVHVNPPPDIYNQLMELLANAQGGGGSGISTGIAEAIFCGSDNSETGIAVSLGVVEPEPLGKADMMQHAWEQGSAQDFNGAFTVSSTKRLRCLDYIDIPDGTVSMVVHPLTTSGEQMMLCLYFYKETNAYISYKGWVAYGTTVTPPSGAKKVRIILRKQDTNAEVAVDELESCGMTFYDY